MHEFSKRLFEAADAVESDRAGDFADVPLLDSVVAVTAEQNGAENDREKSVLPLFSGRKFVRIELID